MRGGRPEPPSDAFGPCFAREPGPSRTGYHWVRVAGVDDARCAAR